MSNRSEYLKEYRRTHKAEIKKYAHKKYLEDRDERLTYQRSYDILHMEERMAKRQILTKSDLLDGIHPCLRKYGKKWGIPCEDYRSFIKWSIDDPKFNQLYKEWEESGFNKFLRPVVMRQVKKNGFIQENLVWSKKGLYSWWSEDADIIKDIEKNLDDQQKERNKSSLEWRKKIREEWKAKQKAKRRKHESSN